MDSCVRCLRDGGADAASVVLLLDEMEGCAGGDAVLEQVCYLKAHATVCDLLLPAGMLADRTSC
jgi:hypothetical protein